MPKTITRDSIVSFIKANEHRSNPGARGLFGARLGLDGTCEYFDYDQHEVLRPSCVIGNVLALAGITPDNYYIPNESAGSVFGYYLSGLEDIDFEAGVGDFATDVQAFADRGYAWGTALRLALIQRGEEL